MSAPCPVPTNLVARGVRRRRVMGFVWLVCGVAAAVWLLASHAAREWRVFLAIPFALSAIGFLQARERTCVMLAAVDKREVHDPRGYETVESSDRAPLRRRAVSIVIRSALIAAAATAAIWFL